MKKLDNIRANQSMRQNKKQLKEVKKQRSKRRRSVPFRVFVAVMKILTVLMFVGAVVGAMWIYNQFDFTFGDDFSTFSMRLSSTIYCMDEDGVYVEYEQFKSSEKRIWVDSEDIPDNLKNAFVAIEDQRFYEHKGVDLKRTIGAVLNVFVKGDSSYGGSTITQQLIKNITQDNERTSARKIREITRAIVLEQKMTKDEILEMYMNSIYLSQGVHGVEAAANVYFNKSVDELSLAECASIAGITQYPTTYDPILNPQNNKKKQLTVLSKMRELDFIDESQYKEALEEELDIQSGKKDSSLSNPDDIQSYFADHIFEQAKNDLIKEFGYTEVFAEDYLCNGGLKIYATVDPEIQAYLEQYYADSSNFPKFSGDALMESAIIVCDPFTGELKGIVGGRGEKEGNRVLNRATQSKRQPGSTIKPIAVYSPALEENIVNLATYIDNSKVTYPGGWTPVNANGRYSGPVSIKTAVAYSYNLPAIRVLEELTVDKSYDYLKNKMHMESIVDSVMKNGKEYTDKTLPSLALGGLTDGVTPLEMSVAYSTIANGGTYIEPTSYTKILDKDDKLVYEKNQKKNKVFSKATAFLMQQLLENVVDYGTAANSKIPGMDTCGKTGTTDDNKDKWFIGFTPYYCTTVWTGFDKPKVIGAGINPALTVWKNVMTNIHQELDNAEFEQPDTVVKAKVCRYTGFKASAGCGSLEFANEDFVSSSCRSNHKNSTIGTVTKTYESSNKSETDKKKEENKKNNSENNEESNDDSPSNATGENSSSSNSESSNTAGGSENSETSPGNAGSGETSGNSGTASGSSSNSVSPDAG